MSQFPEKNHKLTDVELPIKVSQVVDSMERDEAEFITRGVSALDRQAMETLGNEYEELLPDDYYRGRIVSATDAKEVVLEELFKLVQKVSGFVQQKYGIGSGEYISLKVKGYANKPEDGKLKAARSTATAAELLLAELSPIGLTQGMIDDLRAKAQELEDGIDLLAAREGERRNATKNRINKGNELYDLLAKYCEIGKLIWENENPAYYEDYVIYKTVHHGLSKVQNFVGTTAGPNFFDFTWDMVTGATAYEFEWAQASTGQPQPPWDNRTTENNNVKGLDVFPGFTYWARVRAVNTDGQTGGWSDTVTVEGQ